MLIVMAGLPGSGKSAVARALGALLGVPVLDKDLLRRVLLPTLSSFSSDDNDFTIETALRSSARLLREPRLQAIILDGRTFAQRRQVKSLERTCAALEVQVRFVLCTCRPTTAAARVYRDQQRGEHPAPDRTPEAYWRIFRTAQPLQRNVIRVDTEALSAEGAAEAVARELRINPPERP